LTTAKKKPFASFDMLRFSNQNKCIIYSVRKDVRVSIAGLGVRVKFGTRKRTMEKKRYPVRREHDQKRRIRLRNTSKVDSILHGYISVNAKNIAVLRCRIMYRITSEIPVYHLMTHHTMAVFPKQPKP